MRAAVDFVETGRTGNGGKKVWRNNIEGAQYRQLDMCYYKRFRIAITYDRDSYGHEFLWFINITERRPLIAVRSCQECWSNTKMVPGLHQLIYADGYICIAASSALIPVICSWKFFSTDAATA